MKIIKRQGLRWLLILALIGFFQSPSVVTADDGTLVASYTTGAEVPLTAAGFTATGKTVTFTLNHAPTRGANFTVVKNTASSFIQGTFANLPNGTPVDLTFGGSTYEFIAWYYGGDGNDLVLLWRDTGIAVLIRHTSDPLGSNSSDRVLPSGVLAGKTVVTIATGKYHSLALCSDGTLAGWGLNDSGQLGDNSTTDRSDPVAIHRNGVLAGKTVIALAACASHSLALCSDGTVAAWGSNRSGLLGDNSDKSWSATPVAVYRSGVLAGKTVIAITAGEVHNLALCSDGTIAAWGWSGSAQLGNNYQLSPRGVAVAVDRSGALTGKTVVAIAAGQSHSLALCSDGTLTAWGDNYGGQLGDGRSSVVRGAPVIISQNGALFGKTVIAIAAGGVHSLALCSDGSLAAWGSNAMKQLGFATHPSWRQVTEPEAVNQRGTLANKTVIAISAGAYHSLALCSDGSLAAWGSYTVGYSSSEIGDQPQPVLQDGFVSGNRFLNVRRSGPMADYGLALFHPGLPEVAVEQPANTDLTDGTSEISFGTTVPIGGAIEKTFTLRNYGPGVLRVHGFTFEGADASDFAVTRSPAGRVASGVSTEFKVRFTPSSLGEKTATLHVANDDPDEHPFDITLTGGCIAVSTIDADYQTGQEVPLLATAGFVANGNTVNFTLNHAPIRGANLMVVQNTAPGFIQGTLNGLPNGAPVDLSFGGIIYHFIAWYYGGDGNDLVLLWRDTGVAAWGNNRQSKLGLEGFSFSFYSPRPSSVYQSGVMAGKTIVSLAAGGDHSLALCSDGTLAAWGDFNYGQLGNNFLLPPQFDVPVPVAVDRGGVVAGKTVVAIAAGSYHSLALCSDGTLVAWGRNSGGQLGDGSYTQRNVPVAVNQNSILAGKTVVAIAAGNAHSLALCTDGTLAAWGSNGSGQLGDNSTIQRNLPVAVNQRGDLAGKTVLAIAAGSSHSLALCTDGTLAAWGSNGSGQLGDQLLFNRSVPLDVTQRGVLNGKTVVAITAGSSHSLALCSDGSLAAWGSNGRGQLGTESPYTQNSPAAVYQGGVLAGKAVIAISAGSLHNLAFCSDGSIAVWGENSDGQLGDNSATDRAVPVAVLQNGPIADNRFLALARSSPSATHSLALYGLPPEIAVEQPVGNNLTDVMADISFGFTALNEVANERTITIRNIGPGELFTFGITIDGANAGDFAMTRGPASQVVSGGFTTFTVRFIPTGIGAKTAVIHIASNDNNENPFDITLNGTGIPVVNLRLGDPLHLDLSWARSHGQTLRVRGLPPGLVFNAGPPPTITGTVMGPAPAGGTFFQVLEGNSVVRTIPLELVIESYQPSGTYEFLLEEVGQPTGKLRLAVANPTKASPNPAFTATLERLGEPKRSTKGSFTATGSPQTVPVVFPLFKTYPAITFDMVLTTGSDLVTAATSPASGLTARGFRLARPSRIPTGNPALTLTLLPMTYGDRTTTPGGIGHAKGTVSSAALVSLSGQLGDAQPFTTALSLSQTKQAVVWFTPYTDKQSYLGGIIGIPDIGAADRGASLDAATTGLQWKKQADSEAAAYPGGFGPLAMSAKCSRWVATPKAEGLAQSLGLDFRSLDVAYIAPTAEELPTRLSLRDNLSLLPVAPADAVPFIGKATPATGTFAGTLKLPVPATNSALSGVFLQDDIHSPLIGQGLVKIPIAGGVKGSFQTFGIEFRQATPLGSYRFRIGDAVSIDLSSIVLDPGETLKVLGLPKGLALTGSAITGTVYGRVDSSGVQIQVLNDGTVVRSFPLDLFVEPYVFAGSYEVLLEEAGLPVGKLKVTITSPTIDAPYAACTATLDQLGHPRRSGKGAFLASGSSQTVPVIFPRYKKLPAVGYVLTLAAGSDVVVSVATPSSSMTGRGFRLARLGHTPTGNQAFTMTFPPVVPGDITNTPGGVGYAKGTVNSQALIPLAGMFGDAHAFTASLNFSQTNQAVIWLTPYKNKSSYFGGIVDIAAAFTSERRLMPAELKSGLKWARVSDPRAPAYAKGFSAQLLTCRTSHWVPAKNATALAEALGLNFRIINATYVPLDSPSAMTWSLRDNLSLVRTYPAALYNYLPFPQRVVGSNGTFRGTLTANPPELRSAMSGVFLQNAAPNAVIGHGLFKAWTNDPRRDSFVTVGIELKN